MQQRKITLRAARVNAGLETNEVAKRLGITRMTLSRLETDSSNIRMGRLMELSALYRWPIEGIYVGKESDYHNELMDNDSVDT